MTIALPVLAVAFAAFCIWLAVRIVNRKERWAKWAASIIAAICISYLAAPGPIYLARHHECLPEWTYRPLITLYTPLIVVCDECEPFRLAMKWYVGLWTDDLPIILSE